MVYELICRYDTRKSFYGKAHTFVKGNKLLLKSYNTIVAEKSSKNGKTIYKNYGRYSQTTTRHQKEFFKQLGLNEKQLKELLKNGILEV